MNGQQLHIRHLLVAIATLSLSACTSTQVKDGASWAAGEIFTLALEIATDSGKAEPREYDPKAKTYWRTYCDSFCEHRREAWIDARFDEVRHFKRREEAEAFQSEFDEFMRQLEEAERASADSPLIVVTRTDWQVP